MPVEYDPSSPFVTDMTDRLDPGTLQILNDVYAVRDPVDMRRRLITPEIQDAHQVLGALILSETIEQVFPNGITPAPKLGKMSPNQITDEDIALFDAAEGWTAIESASENGITIVRARTLRLKVNEMLGAKNITESVFKSVIQGVIEVKPVKSTLAPPMLLPKHLEVLGFIAQGHSSTEIGEILGTTEGRITGVINSMLKIVKTNTRPAAVYQAFKKGIWQLPPEFKQPSPTE